MKKKYKKLMWEIEKAESPLAVLGSLEINPTRMNAKKLKYMARKTEITFTKREIAKFDRDLSEELI